MALPLSLLRAIQTGTTKEAWTAVLGHAWAVCSEAVGTNAAAEIVRRDRDLAALDLLLSTAAADLWKAFDTEVEKTSDALATWWEGRPPGRAVLILDGLSLRELPLLLEAADARGFIVKTARGTGAELPAETAFFARALGFPQRSVLENNGAGSRHRLPGARTDAVGIPWEDCISRVGAEPDWVFWHHWPDDRVHDLAAAGQGLNALAVECTKRLKDDAFWSLLERLAVGRRLVVTSDHGYAATGNFHDSSEPQNRYLKAQFASGRSVPGSEETGPWVPPVDLTLTSRHGEYRYALGRRKWKSQGGYPTLTHGGLSVLEVLSPFVELTRKG